MTADVGKPVLVTGRVCFIGHKSIEDLARRGRHVRGVDPEYPKFEPIAAHEFEILDLRRWDSYVQAMRGMQHVYTLATDMGAIRFVKARKARIVRDSTRHFALIDESKSMQRGAFPACLCSGSRGIEDIDTRRGSHYVSHDSHQWN